MEVDDAAQINLYSTGKSVKIENIFYYIFITSIKKKEIKWLDEKDLQLTGFLISMMDPTLWWKHTDKQLKVTTLLQAPAPVLQMNRFMVRSYFYSYSSLM